MSLSNPAAPDVSVIPSDLFLEPQPSSGADESGKGLGEPKAHDARGGEAVAAPAQRISCADPQEKPPPAAFGDSICNGDAAESVDKDQEQEKYYVAAVSDKKGIKRPPPGMRAVLDELQHAQSNGSVKDIISSKKLAAAAAPAPAAPSLRSSHSQKDAGHPPPSLARSTNNKPPERSSIASTASTDFSVEDEGYSHQVAREAVKSRCSENECTLPNL
ncbi:hypothetical protein CBR_g36609 [Chara braunii]|uniref:Uncharacterized protein n=1 Tax=Chara braunii TaxID=69332 RepID=A0A388JZA9_CHABU|nr:hypothetical protein CBR_g36609 [Chara braunii]|eukprot:GBG63122.1 hypothetical protein CBR_g36609 [Chara braunii]